VATRTIPFKGDPFAELGVSPTASIDEVRSAFRRRARETHPDHQPDDPHAARRFARLRAAYEEALERIKQGERRERPRPRVDASERSRRGKGITEHELATRVHHLDDPAALRRVLVRHGHRPLIGAALARNPAFPTDALPALRRSTEAHWLVDTAVADRADVSPEMLIEIARLAREPAVGMAVVGNEKSDGTTLDALVHGPVRMDAPLENALAAHPELSTVSAARLAGRHATNVSAVLRLIDRGDLPEELVRRLAAQSTRPLVATAARNDLLRRGLPVPPQRMQRTPKSMTGYWRQ
jgi:hypothetical protein